jgi:aerobic C4-dicarboxylate transport protein
MAESGGSMNERRPWYTVLYVQVLIAIAVGVLVGHFFPHAGAAMKPLGDGFIQLIKMIIAPVIFFTVVHGIASMSDLKKIGRVGVKTLVYFEAVSTVALVIGLIVAEVVQPGHGFNIDPATLDPKSVAGYVTRAKEEGFVAHVLAIIPNTFVGALANGDILQVLLVAILTGFAVARMGAVGERVLGVIDVAGKVLFRIIAMIVRLAPLGAFGAMAFTIGTYGVGALVNLGELILTFYATALLFVLLVLGAISRLAGFSIFRFIGYIKDELLIVLGTSSSETVLPHMMQKMERLGASRPVVGLVIPTGYSFNLDGTNIYMTLATLFLAQATNTHLTLGQELTILGVAMLTSKGASGVTGAGFVTLAATLSIIPDIPIQSLAILVGIDKFMSECRALTNLVGNGVATVVISRWEGELDRDKLHEAMAHPLELGEALERQPV